MKSSGCPGVCVCESCSCPAVCKILHIVICVGVSVNLVPVQVYVHI